MIAPEIVHRVHNSVCAIGVLPVPLVEWRRRPRDNPLRVHGSGFLIAPNTVITNQHVLDTARADAEEFGLPVTQLFLSFITPSRVPVRIGTVRMMRRTHTPAEGDIDIGLVEIRAEPESHFEDIVPLEVSESPSVAVSEEVFLCGYPYGNILLEPEGRPFRFGPVIQQGHVSGLSPYAGSEAPDEILLDVRTAGGMSGCPVIRARTGEVIGIHYEVMTETARIATTCFAIPLDSRRVSGWLAEFDRVLRDA